MANPRDNAPMTPSNPPDGPAPSNSNPQATDPVFLNGEMYLDDRTGRTMVKVPAGGAGGGVTSYAVMPASEEQHVAHLKSLADRKQAEHHDLQQKHEEADQKLQERQAEARDSEQSALDVNNPLTAETYGRPPQHVPAANQTGPVNPADQRDYTDNQPRTESPVQPDPNQKPEIEPAPEPQPAA